jgi:hypothetical protein
VSLRRAIRRDGRPLLQTRVFVPERRTSLAVDFLVDTGADRTVLMPNDAGPLGLDHDDVEVHVLGSGFGGVAVGTREWISVALLEPGVGEYRIVVHADVLAASQSSRRSLAATSSTAAG